MTWSANRTQVHTSPGASGNDQSTLTVSVSQGRSKLPRWLVPNPTTLHRKARKYAGRCLEYRVIRGEGMFTAGSVVDYSSAAGMHGSVITGWVA